MGSAQVLANGGLQDSEHGVDVLFAGVGHGMGSRRPPVVAGQFPGEVVGELFNPLDALS